MFNGVAPQLVPWQLTVGQPGNRTTAVVIDDPVKCEWCSSRGGRIPSTEILDGVELGAWRTQFDKPRRVEYAPVHTPSGLPRASYKMLFLRGRFISRTSPIWPIVVAALLAAAVPSAPGVELLTSRSAGLPVEESECEEESLGFAVTRHRRVRIKSDVRSTDGHASSEAGGSLPLHARRSPSRFRCCLPNGLPAPLIC